MLAEGHPLLAAALDAGYADQAHLNREFREFSGITPGAYRRLAPAHPNHVPLGDCRNVQDDPGHGD